MTQFDLHEDNTDWYAEFEPGEARFYAVRKGQRMWCWKMVIPVNDATTKAAQAAWKSRFRDLLGHDFVRAVDVYPHACVLGHPLEPANINAGVPSLPKHWGQA